MYWKLLKNDLNNHFLQTFSIGFFIMISVAFLATAGQLGVQLTDSMNHLFKEARTPHLLQMHTGDIDVERMENFVASHAEITDYQILPFLNIDNAFAKFSDTKTYVQQIFGNTIHMVSMVTWLAFGVAITLVFIITLLFIRMVYLKDQSENALMKALGFSNTSLYHQYFFKAGLVLLISLILGNGLAMTLGDRLASGVLSVIGVSGVQFIRDPIFVYLLVPVTMLISTMSATYLGLKGLKTMNIAYVLKEE